jgi:hypothetical protein
MSGCLFISDPAQYLRRYRCAIRIAKWRIHFILLKMQFVHISIFWEVFAKKFAIVLFWRSPQAEGQAPGWLAEIGKACPASLQAMAEIARKAGLAGG